MSKVTKIAGQGAKKVGQEVNKAGRRIFGLTDADQVLQVKSVYTNKKNDKAIFFKAEEKEGVCTLFSDGATALKFGKAGDKNSIKLYQDGPGNIFYKDGGDNEGALAMAGMLLRILG